jgi:hypothetical protein
MRHFFFSLFPIFLAFLLVTSVTGAKMAEKALRRRTSAVTNGGGFTGDATGDIGDGRHGPLLRPTIASAPHIQRLLWGLAP